MWVIAVGCPLQITEEVVDSLQLDGGVWMSRLNGEIKVTVLPGGCTAPGVLQEPENVQKAARILCMHLKKFPHHIDLPSYTPWEKVLNMLVQVGPTGLYDLMCILYSGFSTIPLKCEEWTRVVELVKTCTALPLSDTA
jgi:hypothetical protein